MPANTIARGSATRTANKIKRRQRIIDCAGELIAQDGLDALTLSRLAKKADVTIPTIHNLIGRKDAIYQVLVEQMLDEITAAFEAKDVSDPIVAVETFIDRLLGLFAGNESLYKAAYMAGERKGYFEHDSQTGVFARSVDLAYQVCQTGRIRGDLEGRIDTRQLANRLFASQRLARQDWVAGYIDLETYRVRVLSGMFVTLCADASPDFKNRLLSRLKTLAP